MADETQSVQVPEGQAQQTPAAAQNTETPTEHMIPKSRFDELNRELKALKAQLETEAKAKEAAEAQRLKEQGEWKSLAEKYMAELDAAKQQARALELANMRRDVAQKLGIPAALVDRLQGETPEEMEADGKAIMEALPKPTVNGVPSTPTPKVAVDTSKAEEGRQRFALNYRDF